MTTAKFDEVRQKKLLGPLQSQNDFNRNIEVCSLGDSCCDYPITSSLEERQFKKSIGYCEDMDLDKTHGINEPLDNVYIKSRSDAGIDYLIAEAVCGGGMKCFKLAAANWENA